MNVGDGKRHHSHLAVIDEGTELVLRMAEHCRSAPMRAAGLRPRDAEAARRNAQAHLWVSSIALWVAQRGWYRRVQ